MGEEGLLRNSQYAFIAKKGTEGPLLLWSLMNDSAYLNKEDQARGQGGLKHGYISPRYTNPKVHK